MKKILDPKNLPYAGAIVQAVLFAIAGNQALPRPGWLVGLGAGAVVNWSMALASSRINDIAEKRKPMARLALVGMFLLSPTTITLSLTIPESTYTHIAWAACVDLAIVLGGAIAGKSLMPEATPAKSAQQPAATRSAKGSGRSKGKSETKRTVTCRYAPQCERTFATQNAANAHARGCGFKPIAVMMEEQQQKGSA